MDAFWSKVDTTAGPDACWPWTACTNWKGYGLFRGRPSHRVAYERVVGAIPQGLVIDHLCRNRACTNPAHMEAVTNRENVLRSPIGLTAVNARKDRCIHGHPYTPENTVVTRLGRACRTCKNAWNREYMRTRRTHT